MVSFGLELECAVLNIEVIAETPSAPTADSTTPSWTASRTADVTVLEAKFSRACRQSRFANYPAVIRTRLGCGSAPPSRVRTDWNSPSRRS